MCTKRPVTSKVSVCLVPVAVSTALMLLEPQTDYFETALCKISIHLQVSCNKAGTALLWSCGCCVLTLGQLHE